MPSDKITEFAHLKTVALHRFDMAVRVQAAFYESHPAEREVEIRLDDMARMLEAQVRLFLTSGSEHETIRARERVPADWWAAVKLRWFPAWALRSWPAALREIATTTEVYRLCPHSDIRWRDNPRGHAQWIAGPFVPMWREHEEKSDGR